MQFFLTWTCNKTKPNQINLLLLLLPLNSFPRKEFFLSKDLMLALLLLLLFDAAVAAAAVASGFLLSPSALLLSSSSSLNIMASLFDNLQIGKNCKKIFFYKKDFKFNLCTWAILPLPCSLLTSLRSWATDSAPGWKKLVGRCLWGKSWRNWRRRTRKGKREKLLSDLEEAGGGCRPRNYIFS